MNRTGCFYLPYFDKIDKKTKKVVEIVVKIFKTILDQNYYQTKIQL